MGSSSFSTGLRQVVALVLLAGLFAGALVLARGARLDKADFTFCNGAEIQSLDPASVTGVPEGRVLRAIFEGLVVKHPETLEPVPGMAESWSISEDGLTYHFHIRHGAHWSNGDPVTAHDFVYSFERFLNPLTAAQYAYQLWYVKGAEAYTKTIDDDGQPALDFDSTVAIRAVEEHLLEIELNSPTPFFLSLMGFYPMFPVNRRNIEEAKERWPASWEIKWLHPENLVTNGPYRVAMRRVNDRIRLVKNQSYWDAEHVAMNTIDVLATENEGTMLNLYLTGEVDWIERIKPEVADIMLAREDFNPRPYLGTYFYRVNVTKPPFDDLRVRRALSLAIPRTEICLNVTRLGEIPYRSLVPDGLRGYTPARCEPENLALAKNLLEQAGYGPNGKPFPTLELHYNTAESHAAIAQVVALAWQNELGIRTKLRNEEWKVYLATQEQLRYDVSRSAWIGDYDDPNTFLDMFMTGNKNNKTGWANAQYDALIRQSIETVDPEERLGILHDAERLLIDDLPILPIYMYVTKNLVSPRLGGFYENIQNEHFPKFWYWMDDEELAEKRADYMHNRNAVEGTGPKAGLYAPAGGTR